VSKKLPSARRFRVCEHCGRDSGTEGPRDPGSMIKLVGSELKFACSVDCGIALGWRSV
jgi:hypothetical protein